MQTKLGNHISSCNLTVSTYTISLFRPLSFFMYKIYKRQFQYPSANSVHYTEITYRAGEGLRLLLVERNTATKPGKESIELDPSLTSSWMEKLWSHTSLGTTMYLMCVFPTTALCSPSFPVFVSPPPTCLNCFVSISWMHVNTHTHTHIYAYSM